APREALLAAAAKRGLPIVLPGEAALAKSGISAADLAKAAPATLAGQGGEVALVGRMVWDDRKLGWITLWRMTWQGQPGRRPVRSRTCGDAPGGAAGCSAPSPAMTLAGARSAPPPRYCRETAIRRRRPSLFARFVC